MKILHGLFLLLCTSFALTAQTTYYVSNLGSDVLNDGLTDSTAFQSIQFAIDNAMEGDSIVVLEGIYFERLVFNVSGIVLQGESNSIINGLVFVSLPGAPGAPLISIHDKSDITIRGFTIESSSGSGASGVTITGSSQDIIISGNEFSDIDYYFHSVDSLDSTAASYPILVRGDSIDPIDNVTIINNVIRDSELGIGSGIEVVGNVLNYSLRNNNISDLTNSGIAIVGSSSNPTNGTITGNNILQNSGDAISIEGPVNTLMVMSNSIRDVLGDAIYIDGAANTLMERNLILSNGGTAVNVSAGDAITVRNNLISANDGPAIALGEIGAVTNSMIRNNSTYNNGLDSTQAELSISSASSTSVINNIFSNVSGRILSAASGADLVLNYNLYNTTGSPSFNYGGTSYSSLEEYSTAEAQDTNSIYGDPAYQGTGQGSLNFHLTMASPAINAGDPNTVVGGDEVDAYGDLRIVDDVIDMGASEFPDVLPVTYLSPFKANLINDIVQMDWHTAEEINSDHFEVQRSTDLENWTTIVSMPSVGESHLYEAADREPLDGTTYYRLMQVDLDGSTDLSHIEIISVNKSTETRIFPNPAASWLRIEAGIGATVSEVRIFDLTGKMIMRSFDEGTNVTVDLTQLSTGTYVVQYRTNEGVKATKIQKN